MLQFTSLEHRLEVSASSTNLNSPAKYCAGLGLNADAGRENLTGEFDPGSERTLAARLTHASRTRKGFGPGKVAHG